MEVRDIVEMVDLLEFAENYYNLSFRQEGREYWCLSPLKNEKTPSFNVNQEKQTWYDFSTGQGGDVLTLIERVENCSFGEALAILKKYLNICEEQEYYSLPTAVRIAKRFKPVVKKQTTSISEEYLPSTYMQIYEDPKDKLNIWLQEGMDKKVLEEFQVRYDPFQDRLVFPIRDYMGNIVNVSGRTLATDFKERGLRKYTYYKKWPGGQMNVLYGFHEHINNIKRRKQVICVEGAKSVFLAETFGYDNAVALLTSHMSEGQFKQLISLGVSIVMALDKDVNVLHDKNIQRLKHYCDVFYIRDTENLTGEKDSPVDKGKEVFDYLYERRRRLR